MSEYEKEVVNLIKFKVGEYEDRQDYLASLIRATDKWLQKHDANGDIFDGWDNDLAGWFDEAVHAMNAKKEIPDFPDAELGDEESVPDETESEDESAEVAGPEADPEDSVPPNGPAEQDSEPQAEEMADAETSQPRDEGSSQSPKPKYKGKVKTRYDDCDDKKRDRFGVIIGTKTHDVVALYEKGTTSAEIEEKIGGRHYNILRTLAKKGHRVAKMPGGGFKLTHKDDLRDPE